MVVREQSDMLLSMYKQYIQAGGGMSFGQFATPREGAGSIASFRFDYLEYHRLIGCYHGLFGRGSVLVLPYELLRSDPGAFLDAIGEFCGADLGPPPVERQKESLSAAALYAARHGNRLFALTGLNPAPLFPLNGGARRVKKLSKKLDRRLPDSAKNSADDRWRAFAQALAKSRYNESNARTQALIGCDLSPFGYQL